MIHLPNLTHEDLRAMQTSGRFAAYGENEKEATSRGLEHAIAMTLLTDRPEERRTLRSWFEEGVRNNVNSMKEYTAIMEKYDERVATCSSNIDPGVFVM